MLGAANVALALLVRIAIGKLGLFLSSTGRTPLFQGAEPLARTLASGLGELTAHVALRKNAPLGDCPWDKLGRSLDLGKEGECHLSSLAGSDCKTLRLPFCQHSQCEAGLRRIVRRERLARSIVDERVFVAIDAEPIGNIDHVLGTDASFSWGRTLLLGGVTGRASVHEGGGGCRGMGGRYGR